MTVVFNHVVGFQLQVISLVNIFDRYFAYQYIIAGCKNIDSATSAL